MTQQYKGSRHDGFDLVGLSDKNLYAPCDGLIDAVGWQNINDHSEGFGLRIRLIEKGTSNYHYFGHLSSHCVKIRQNITKGQKIGVEGNTGRSTGSHLHWCIRKNNSKNQIVDISSWSGIPNKLGTHKVKKHTVPKPTLKKVLLAKKLKNYSPYLVQK